MWKKSTLKRTYYKHNILSELLPNTKVCIQCIILEQHIATSSYLKMLNSALSLTSESISQPTLVTLGYICNFITAFIIRLKSIQSIMLHILTNTSLVQFNVVYTLHFTVTKYCMLIRCTLYYNLECAYRCLSSLLMQFSSKYF